MPQCFLQAGPGWCRKREDRTLASHRAASTHCGAGPGTVPTSNRLSKVCLYRNAFFRD